MAERPLLNVTKLKTVLGVFPADRQSVTLDIFIGDIERLSELAAVSAKNYDEEAFAEAAHALAPVLETIGCDYLLAVLQDLRNQSQKERAENNAAFQTATHETINALLKTANSHFGNQRSIFLAK